MNLEKLKEYRNLSDGFIQEIGLEVTEVTDGEAIGVLQLEERHGNPIGSIHGGCLFSVADTVGGVAATSKGRMVTTIDGSMHYLNAARVGDLLTVHAKVIKSGKSFAVVDVTLSNQEQKLLSTATLTYHYMSKDFDLDQMVEELKKAKKKQM
ncbi:MAG: PaaI family thioesterase [Eubacterium sp.]|nr:PaaI family thioesterase [Eubacterium sp.]